MVLVLKIMTTIERLGENDHFSLFLSDGYEKKENKIHLFFSKIHCSVLLCAQPDFCTKNLSVNHNCY